MLTSKLQTKLKNVLYPCANSEPLLPGTYAVYSLIASKEHICINGTYFCPLSLLFIFINVTQFEKIAYYVLNNLPHYNYK